jgi:hypothetical protein
MGTEHAGERAGRTGQGGGSTHAQRGRAGSAGRRPRLGAGGSAVLVGDGVRHDTGKGTAQGGLQGLGNGTSGGGAGRCRNTRRKARCRGMAVAVQRRAEEEDAWGSRG